jgi:hypothetical protein
MHKNRGRSRGAKSCGYFASDQAALPYASYNYSRGTAMKQFNAVIESLCHRPGEAIGEILQGPSFYTDNVFPDAVHR